MYSRHKKPMLLTTHTWLSINGVRRCMLAAPINRGVVFRTTVKLNHHLVLYIWYIYSLRQLLHHHIICTHFPLLLDQNGTYEGPHLSHKLPNKTLPDHNIMLCSMRFYGVFWGLFNLDFTHIDILRLCNGISVTLRNQNI